MPFQDRFCTYRQSRDRIERYGGCRNEDDFTLIVGNTAGRILVPPRQQD